MKKSSTQGTGARRRATLTAVTTVLALVVVMTAAAAAEELPNGAAVLDRYVEVTGGAEAYAKLDSSRITGKLEMPAQGLAFEMVRFSARPNKAAVIMTSEAFGEIRRGTDGAIAWESSVMTGPRVMEGEELAEAVRDAMFDSVAEWRLVWEEATTTGVEVVNEKPCYRVELKPRAGGPQTVYFDVETGLMAKVERQVNSVVGTVPVASYPSDWREAGGVLVSHRAEVVASGQKRVVTLASVEYNVELPAGCFDPPDEVKELLAKAAPSR